MAVSDRRGSSFFAKKWYQPTSDEGERIKRLRFVDNERIITGDDIFTAYDNIEKFTLQPIQIPKERRERVDEPECVYKWKETGDTAFAEWEAIRNLAYKLKEQAARDLLAINENQDIPHDKYAKVNEIKQSAEDLQSLLMALVNHNGTRQSRKEAIERYQSEQMHKFEYYGMKVFRLLVELAGAIAGFFAARALILTTTALPETPATDWVGSTLQAGTSVANAVGNTLSQFPVACEMAGAYLGYRYAHKFGKWATPVKHKIVDLAKDISDAYSKKSDEKTWGDTVNGILRRRV